ncbi:MAG: alpha/beta hydrolase [Nevskia sp.]|nr:alpha/beta hydrolase [Nevskia sp.]
MSIAVLHQESPPEVDVYEQGSGSTLVLLHGLSGTWHIWKPVLDRLQAYHHVIAPTLPGHRGGPPMPAGVEPTVAAMADLLIATFAARGIHSAHVVGNSLGGWLALELARRGFARSVVVFSPAGAWRRPQDYRDVSRPFSIFFVLMPLLLMLTTLFLGFAWLRRALGRQTMEHAERIAPTDFRDSLSAFSKTTVLPTLLRTMGRDGPIAGIDAPGTPIRIVWGEQDRVIPFERYGRPMLERVPAAECLHLAGVGHVPMYDDPAKVAQAILDVTTAADASAMALPAGAA